MKYIMDTTIKGNRSPDIPFILRQYLRNLLWIILGKGEEEVGQARHLLSSPEGFAKQSLHTRWVLLHLDECANIVEIVHS